MGRECACVHFDNGKCKKFSDDEVTSWCIEGPCEDQTPSNADRIRAMSDEELAKWMLQFVIDCAEKTTGEECEFEDGSEDELVNWLKQPAEE